MEAAEHLLCLVTCQVTGPPAAPLPGAPAALSGQATEEKGAYCGLYFPFLLGL